MKRTLGVTLFALGLLLGIAFTALAVWGDLEASLFEPAGDAETTLRSLACPVIITRGETGVFSASFRNTSQNPVRRAVRAQISQGRVTFPREESTHLPLAPGETQRMRWTVDARDAAYGYLILVRVSTLRQYPLPSQSATCGILVLDVPLVRGIHVVVAWVALSLAGMLAGGWLGLAGRPWRAGPLRGLILGGVVTIGIVIGLLGLWVAGVLLLALIVLMLVAMLAQAMLAR